MKSRKLIKPQRDLEASFCMFARCFPTRETLWDPRVTDFQWFSLGELGLRVTIFACVRLDRKRVLELKTVSRYLCPGFRIPLC